MNAAQLMSLPSTTPHGNVLLQYMTIIGRLDEANRQIDIAYVKWERFMPQRSRPDVELTKAFDLHRFAMKYATVRHASRDPRDTRERTPSVLNGVTTQSAHRYTQI